MELNPSPKDGYGRPLKEGDAVQVIAKGPVVFRVASIDRNVDPRAPIGHLVMHLIATVSFNVKEGATHDNILRVGTLEEFGPMPIQLSEIRTRLDP